MSDGLLVIRHLFGISGSPLTAGALGAGAARAEPGAIAAHAQCIRLSHLDPDGNGQMEPLTDGLLLLRYLFGFRGAVLIDAAVGVPCTRCDAPSIEEYFETRLE